MSEYPRPKRDRGSMRFHRGAWRLTVRAGKAPDGTPRILYGTVHAPENAAGERQAARELAKLVVEADRVEAENAPESAPVLALVDRYIAWGIKRGGVSRKGWSPNTTRNYSWIRHSLVAGSEVGQTVATKLTPGQLGDWYEDIEDERGPDMALQVHRLMHAALGKARKRGQVVINAADDVDDKPRRPKSEVTPPSDDAVRDALRYLAATDTYTHAFVMLAASTGARRGTLVALRWSDVDLDARKVTYRHAIARGTTEGALLGRAAGYTLKGTKADKRYDVSLDPATVAVLRRHRAWWLERMIALPAAAREAGWVFPSPRNPVDPIQPDAMSKRWLDLRRGHPELGTCRLHDLRHYVATSMLDDGHSITAVAKRLGNTPAVVVSTYAHAIDARDKAAAVSMAARLAGAEG